MQRMRVLVLCVLFTAALSAVGLGQSTGEHEVAVEVQPVYILEGPSNAASVLVLSVPGPFLEGDTNGGVAGTAVDELNYRLNVHNPPGYKIQVSLAEPLPTGFRFLRVWTEEPTENHTLGAQLTHFSLNWSPAYVGHIALEYGVWKDFTGAFGMGSQADLDLSYQVNTGWGAASGRYLIRVNWRMTQV